MLRYFNQSAKGKQTGWRILWMMLISTLLQSVGQSQELLTLDDAIAIALANNYNIRLSRYDSTAAALDNSYRNAVFFPRLNATAGSNWVRNSQKQEFTDGTTREGQVANNTLNASVQLNWKLFDGLKMFVLRDKAEQYVELGSLQIRNQVVNTIAEVIVNYYAIVQEIQQLRAIDEQIGVSEVTLDLARQRLEIGVGAKPIVLQNAVDLNAQKSARLSQLTLITQLKDRLNQVLDPSQQATGSDRQTDYAVTDTIIFNPDLVLQAVHDSAMIRNPILNIARKNIDLANLTLRERKADRYPQLDFNAAYNYNRSSNDIALNPFLPIINRTNGFNYGLTLSVPILNYRNTERLIRQAELDIAFQELNLESSQSRLSLDVQNAYAEYQLRQATLELEEENIALARENVSIILQSYQLGQATYIELREAQKSMFDAENRLISARYFTKLAETELLRLSGSLIR